MVSENSENVRPITRLRRDARWNVSAQKFDSDENSTLRNKRGMSALRVDESGCFESQRQL